MKNDSISDECKRTLSLFSYAHLPEKLQEISKPFYTLAHNVFFNFPDNYQKLQCLTKLLEAKDCAVRTKIY